MKSADTSQRCAQNNTTQLNWLNEVILNGDVKSNPNYSDGVVKYCFEKLVHFFVRLPH